MANTYTGKRINKGDTNSLLPRKDRNGRPLRRAPATKFDKENQNSYVSHWDIKIFTDPFEAEGFYTALLRQGQECLKPVIGEICPWEIEYEVAYSTAVN